MLPAGREGKFSKSAAPPPEVPVILMFIKTCVAPVVPVDVWATPKAYRDVDGTLALSETDVYVVEVVPLTREFPSAVVAPL